MIFVLFFIKITKAFSLDSNLKPHESLEIQDLCKLVSTDNNLCIIKEIPTNGNITLNSDHNTTLFVLLQNINNDQIINISQLDVNGKVFLTSDRRLNIHINGDLNINGNVIFNNFFLAVSTLNLKRQSNFIIDTITADAINMDCSDDFVCSSIKAQNFYSINNNITIQINEASNFDNIHKKSTVLTVLNGQSPYFDYYLLNSSSRIVVHEETNTVTSNRNELKKSFNLVAEFLGCRIPNHIVNQSCLPCPENSASLTDGSTQCFLCPNGQEYSTESKSCVSCQPGTYYNQATKKCTLCQIGTYQPNSMQSECLKCPVNSTTITTGETSLYSCVCPAGYYGRSGEECRQCFETEKCDFGSLFPRANAGHWIDENHFYYSVVCQPRYACLGNSTCDKGYEGKFCGSCSQGYFRLHQSCAKCNSAIPPILSILMILIVVLLFYFSVYDHKYFPMFTIFMHFFQEIAMFSFLNSLAKVKFSEFYAYLSFFYFNPQIFQPQCYGLHNWSPSIQIAIAIPLLISLILFICSLLSWAIPSLDKFVKRQGSHSLKTFKGMKFFNYNFWDCIKVFKESVISSFYVFLPAYFGLVMRTIKYSELTLGSTIKYLDLQPSMVYNDPTARPAIISSIIVIAILIIFVICFDINIALSQPKKVNNNKNASEEEEFNENIDKPSYKIIIATKRNSVVSVKGHSYLKIFKNYYWVIIIHLKFILLFVSWIYLQRYLIFQYGFSLAIYTIFFSLQLACDPYTDFKFIALISELLKLICLFVASTQVNETFSSDLINAWILLTICIFILLFIYKIIQSRVGDSEERNVNFIDTSNTDNNDYQSLLSSGHESDTKIDNFINEGFNSIINILKMRNSKIKQRFLQIYFQFKEYAEDSRQDFRNFQTFINHTFRPYILKVVSEIILNQPTFYGVYLDRIANEWKYMEKTSDDSDSSD